MARIIKKDLEDLTSKEIRGYFVLPNPEDCQIPAIKEYLAINDGWGMYNKLHRVGSLLNTIVLERFIKGTLWDNTLNEVR